MVSAQTHFAAELAGGIITTMRTLLASLGEHSIALLRGIAELRNIELASNARADVAAQLAAVLVDPEMTQAALVACSPAAQAAWTALCAAGRRMKVAAFSRLHGEIRPVGPGRLEREATWRQPEGPAEELWYRGLIFRTFADLGEGPLEYVYIPEDLAIPAALSQAAPEPPHTALPALTESIKGTTMANRMAVDACTLLAAVRQTSLPLDKAGTLSAADPESVRSLLLLDDPVYFELLLSLMRTRGWLLPHRDHLVIDQGAAGAWLRATPWQQMTALFSGWRDSTDWNDLRRIPSLHADGEWRNDAPLARAAILDALRTLPAGAWYAIPDLLAHLKATNPDFQRPDGDYTGWYLKDIKTDRYLSGFETWDEVEGRLIHFLLTGPLHWLGAVALAVLPSGASAFRLTAVGAAWLAKTAPAELPRPARLSVSDDFIVTAPLLCPLLDRFRLLRFTEAVPEKGNAPQAGTRHRISRASLTRARASGLKAGAAAEFLKRATGGRLPPRVAAALSRFDQAGGSVHISRGAVLRVADANTLARLRADPAIAPLLGDLISAQAVLVREANLARLLSVIKDSGYDVSVD